MNDILNFQLYLFTIFLNVTVDIHGTYDSLR